MSRSSIGAGAGGSPVVEVHKKRIFDAVNNLNEDELEKISEMLRATEEAAKADAAEDIEGEEQVVELEGVVVEPSLAGVTAADQRTVTQTDEITYQEKLTSVSRAGMSDYSRGVIQKLQSQLEEEKHARKKLETELNSLQVTSSHIAEMMSHMKQ